jgi:hypothetical protein
MNRERQDMQEQQKTQTASHAADPVRLLDGREIVIHLRDGVAYVAELKDGRARLSALSAWLGSNQGGRVLRSAQRGSSFEALSAFARWLSAGVVALGGRLLASCRRRSVPSEVLPGRAAGDVSTRA